MMVNFFRISGGPFRQFFILPPGPCRLWPQDIDFPPRVLPFRRRIFFRSFFRNPTFNKENYISRDTKQNVQHLKLKKGNNSFFKGGF